MDNGWIKLHRKITEWEWFTDRNVLQVFIYLLSTANHSDQNWKGVAVKRGQRITSIDKISKNCNLTSMQVRTAIKKLISTGEITSKTTNKFTLITVENYELYQAPDDEDNKQNNKQRNKQITNKQQTDNKQITTNKNDKKEKKEENDKEIYKDAPAELHPTIKSFIEMRKKIKAPMTDDAIRLMIKKTNKMAGGDIAKSRAIMEQSIMNSWKGVFPLRDDAGRGQAPRNEVLEMMREEAMYDETGDD